MRKSKHPCPCSCPKCSRKRGLPQCYFALLSLLVGIILFLSFPSGSDAKTLHGRVIKVFDGDTMVVKIQGREENVRLREIDAPEISTRKRKGQEPWGKKAKEFLRSKVRNRTVRLEIEDRQERDDYRRLLAYVFLGDLFVNREVMRSGNAFFYAGPFLGKYSKELKKAESEAREKGFGVWNRKNGLREKPWDFRRRTQRKTPFSQHMPHLEEKADMAKILGKCFSLYRYIRTVIRTQKWKQRINEVTGNAIRESPSWEVRTNRD